MGQSAAAAAGEAVARELSRLMQFVYRGASDGELESYADLLESKAGRSMTNATVKGLLGALEVTSRRQSVQLQAVPRSRQVDDYYQDLTPTTPGPTQPTQYLGTRGPSR